MTRLYHWLAMRFWCLAADLVPHGRLELRCILRAARHSLRPGATGNGEAPW